LLKTRVILVLGANTPVQIPVLALLFTLALMGCAGEEEPDGLAGSTGADIDVYPDTLDFSVLCLGEVETRTIALRSVGVDNLLVHRVYVDSDPGFAVDTDGFDWVLATRQKTELYVSFTAESAGTVAGQLFIHSNDGDDPEIVVALEGFGLAPELEVAPTWWDFGDTELGCTREMELEIRNIGTSALTVSQVEFVSYTGDYSMSPAGSADGLLEPQDTLGYIVRHVPQTIGGATAGIRIVSNDPQGSETIIPLTGQGILSAQVEDEFLIDVASQNDILWVLDNTGVMAAAGAGLIAEAAIFFTRLESEGVDYHVGVITTDSGNLRGSPRVITTADVAPAVDFMASASVGTNGVASEQGLAHAVEAVASPLAYPGGYNDGFLREDAHLHVIFVSDEADHSPAATDTYVVALQDLKANPDNVVLSTVSGLGSGCYGALYDAAPAFSYDLAAAATGGMRESICSVDWMQTLHDLAALSATQRDTVVLSQPPIVDSLEVRVNGGDVTENWDYYEESNAMILQPGLALQDGDEVRVTYHPYGGGC